MLSGWIEDQNEKLVQRKRDAKEKVAKAKDKVICKTRQPFEATSFEENMEFYF